MKEDSIRIELGNGNGAMTEVVIEFLLVDNHCLGARIEGLHG